MMIIAVGLIIGLLIAIGVSLEELKTINMEILKQLREKESNDADSD
jgi:hypothetical protein